MIIPDTNLLLYAYNADSEFHSRANGWWQSILQGNETVGIPAVVSVGFVRIATNPTFAGRRMTLEESLSLVDTWFNYPHITELIPAAGHFALFRRILETADVGGKLATDAHIAALAIENDAELHSNDNDFGRFSGLRWHNPLTVTR